MFASFTPAVGSMTTFLLKIMEPSYAFFETQKYVEILNNIWIKFYIGILAIFGNFKSNFRLIDDIAKGSDNSTNKKLNTEVRKCESVVCCITKYDVNISWVMYKVHCLCEGIPPNTFFGDDAVCECLCCRSFIPETLEGYFVTKLEENRDKQFELET